MSHSRFRGLTLALAGILCLSGCATYHALPLTSAEVERKLRPLGDDALAIAARKIKHPLLHSLRLDASDGLSPDEAELLAVLLNPALRALRDQAGEARAQLLKAGILPNPQWTGNLDFVGTSTLTAGSDANLAVTTGNVTFDGTTKLTATADNLGLTVGEGNVNFVGKSTLAAGTDQTLTITSGNVKFDGTTNATAGQDFKLAIGTGNLDFVGTSSIEAGRDESLSIGTGNARDLVSLKLSLQVVMQIKDVLQVLSSPFIKQISHNIKEKNKHCHRAYRFTHS